MGKVVKAIAAVALIVAGVVTFNPQLIAMGLSVGMSALRKTPKFNSNANTDRLNANIVVNQPRAMVFGETAFATDIRDQEFTGTDKEYLHRFIVCAAHTTTSIDEIWFDDKLAWDGTSVQGEFVGYLDVTTCLEGTAGAAVNISARMGTSRRYTGMTYVYFRYKLTGNSKKAESPFSSSVPTRITIKGKGMPTYDPRLDSTVTGGSGAMRADDQSTWAWDDDASRNPAVQAVTALLGWRINGLLSVGKGIPPRRIDLESFITAANVCDEAIALDAGGTEPRYRFDGVFSEGDDLSTILGSYESSMDARFHDPRGRIAVKCMVYDHATPVAEFTQHDVLGAVDWKPYGPLDSRYNIIRGQYTDPSDASLFQMVDYPEIKVTSSDGVDRILTMNFPGVQSATQAQRLARRLLKRAQYGGTFQAELQATAWRAAQYDPVRMTFPKLGMSNVMMRVEEIETSVDGVVPIMMSIENADIYDWTTADELPAIVPVYPTQYSSLDTPTAVALNGMEEGVSVVDGTIKADKVETTAIVSNGVTDGSFTIVASDVSLTNTTNIQIAALTIVKAITGSDLEIQADINFASTDNVVGTFAFYTVVSGSPTTLLGSVDLFVRGNGATRLMQTLRRVNTTLSAGTHTIGVYFTATAGNGTQQAKADSVLSVREIKR